MTGIDLIHLPCSRMMALKISIAPSVGVLIGDNWNLSAGVLQELGT